VTILSEFNGDPRFLFYYLSSAAGRESVLSLASGSSIPALYQNHLKRLRYPKPPLPEQCAIAHILGTLDDKIELNRRMTETLEAIARVLFQLWFVDFDPVRAKAEGRDPGLPKPLADLFPGRLEDSDMGEMPAGWRVGSVDEEFNLTMGQSPPGETYNETGEGIPFYQGRAEFGFRFPSQRVFCTAPTRYADTGDTLVSVRAPVGDVNMAAELLHRPWSCCRPPQIGQSFLHLLFHARHRRGIPSLRAGGDRVRLDQQEGLSQHSTDHVASTGRQRFRTTRSANRRQDSEQ